MPNSNQPPTTPKQQSAVVMWFRRDLRVEANPALNAALKRARDTSSYVLPLFILDPRLQAASGPNRLAFLYEALGSLRRSGLPLVIGSGNPSTVFEKIMATSTVRDVFCANDFTPFGRRRDNDIEAVLSRGGVALHRVGGPYAVDPGVVRKDDGSPFKVFTPFKRVWERCADNSRSSIEGCDLTSVQWVQDVPGIESAAISARPPGAAEELPEASEAAAHNRLERFLQANVYTYDEKRNDPAADSTSRLSADLKFGLLHPAQILPLLAGLGRGAEVFRSELCWREFYADVLFHRPDTLHAAFNPSMERLVVDTGEVADQRFDAWCRGETGFPFVDAGMRQLRREGWMHNRVRMVTASFLVKDLHLDWRRGAAWFLHHLVDGDVASNQHGWQWTAGTGTDASPYYRVFNPVIQGKKFDPTGAYVRKYVPELADLDASIVHEPWVANGGGMFDGVSGYPAPIVDHGIERIEALARHAATKSPST